MSDPNADALWIDQESVWGMLIASQRELRSRIELAQGSQIGKRPLRLFTSQNTFRAPEDFGRAVRLKTHGFWLRPGDERQPECAERRS